MIQWNAAEVNGGKAIRKECQEKNISEATHHRWRAQFGLMEANEARWLKELERENSELKKMQAESLGSRSLCCGP